MDQQDIVTRLQGVMIKFATAPNPADIAPEAEGIITEVEAVAEFMDDGDELRAVAQSFRDMVVMLNNPELAAQFAESQIADLTPYPAIFDAIEDQDRAAITDALKTWDINEGVGEHQSTALYHAMAHSFGVSLDVMHLLLDGGADVSARTDAHQAVCFAGQTAHEMSAHHPNVAALLTRYARPN